MSYDGGAAPTLVAVFDGDDVEITTNMSPEDLHALADVIESIADEPGDNCAPSSSYIN